MKKRKTNKSKRHSPGCRNNGPCSYCRGNRLHAVHKAEEAIDAMRREWEKWSKR